MVIVNENYVIDVDSNCYTVKIDKHKTDKKGNEVYEVVGYYGTLHDAIRGTIKAMNRSKLSHGVHTLEEALKTILESNKHFEEILEKVSGIS